MNDHQTVDAPKDTGGSVLLVDDQPIIAEAVRRMLADHSDLALHYTSRGEEAVDVARELRPSIILQDLVMPGISGLDLLRKYRADEGLRDIPVIVLSTKEEPATKSEAFALGASDYLVKLPDAIELIARLRLHARARQNRLQRDVAYSALLDSQEQLVVSNQDLADRIADLQVARDELYRAVNVDSLTGLASRRRWFEGAAAEFKRYQRYGRRFAVMVADLDLFKRINDTFGHDGGDRVLMAFGAVLQQASRRSDIAGRLGGEEFGVLLPETDAQGAEELARRTMEACRATPVETAGGTVTYSCSIGIAAAKPQDERFDDVLRRADVALYDAKRQGRDRWVVAG
jgi:two-component system, chemotaxis family, response regulator WspR